MAAPSFERALSLVFGSEGGFGDDRRDKGNWTGGIVGKGQLKGTKYGIAASSYPTLDIKNLTLAAAAEIYRRDFAKPIQFDKLPEGVGYCVLDYAINSGPARAVISLQRAVGVADDGKMGPLTLAAVNKANPQVLVSKICAERLTFLRKLSTWPVYGKGWTKRVQKVEQEGTKMAAAPIPDIEPTPAQPSFWARLRGLFSRPA